MLSPLKPLLCRHNFYWSERHRADRCRRCGKVRSAAAVDAAVFAASPLGVDPSRTSISAGGVLIDFQEPTPRPIRSPAGIRPSAKVLKAQARERRDTLLGLLERLAEGGRPTRAEAIDAVLAVIEDAHSAEPVLFGPDAAGHFARLNEARSAQRC